MNNLEDEKARVIIVGLDEKNYTDIISKELVGDDENKSLGLRVDSIRNITPPPRLPYRYLQKLEKPCKLYTCIYKSSSGENHVSEIAIMLTFIKHSKSAILY